MVHNFLNSQISTFHEENEKCNTHSKRIRETILFLFLMEEGKPSTPFLSLPFVTIHKHSNTVDYKKQFHFPTIATNHFLLL